MDRAGQDDGAADELLVGVEIPAPAAGTGSAYLRLEYRRQMEIAVVGATAVVTVADGVVTDARVAMTALSATIRRVPEAEAALVGSDGGSAAIDAAGAAVAAAATPISDVRGSADYRRAMAAVIARRAIDNGALTRPRGGRMKVATTLNVNGISYPVDLDPGRTCWPPSVTSSD